MNGAQSLIQTLVNGGVTCSFTNPGTSEMHFVAALDKVEGMRAVLCLFEGVATAAADGYARMTGEPAATLLHLGPGLGNGIANLHNARRAHTPMINIVGDHATFHLQYDAPLTSDIVSLATPVSGWVKSAQRAELIPEMTVEAIQAAKQNNGQVSTLILPADTAWTPAPPAATAFPSPPVPILNSEAVDAVAKALREGKRTTIVLGGVALQERGLRLASRLAHAYGARVMSNRPSARMHKGAGRPVIDRVPYPIPQAVEALAGTEHLILAGSVEPVGFFGYPGMPSKLAPPEAQVHHLAQPTEDILGALEALVESLNVPDEMGPVAPFVRADLPMGEMALEKVWQTIGALMPEGTILCDESLTSNRSGIQAMQQTVPHDVLNLTGGAIGIGLPLAVGAAVACPDRRVISTQADGSGMYTVQALWTQARENLDIVTVLFNNKAYNILRGELKRVGADANPEKAESLLALDNPVIDWVSIAQGMGVEASRATTADEI